MPKSSFQKKRILFLRDMFLERTDENHPISIDEIIHLLSANGMAAEQRTISDDIVLLQDMGLDIITKRTRPIKYYLVSRDFETHELKLLMDCVQASKFLSEKKTNELIEKLGGLCSKNEAAQLKRLITPNSAKSANERNQLAISTINDAILEDRQITFKYYNYSVTKEKQYQQGGELYHVSPCMVIYANGNYYMLAHNVIREYHVGDFTSYRVDRMEEVTFSTQKRSFMITAFEKLKIGDYLNNFSAYGGAIQRVTLQCPNHLSDKIIDRFGININIRKIDEDHFQITEVMAINPHFFGWIFSLGPEVKIVSPQSVGQEMKDILKDAYKVYTIPRNRKKKDGKP